MADEGQIEQIPPDELPLEERVDVADPPAESSVCMLCMIIAVNDTAAI